ncbi:hypothetical protein HCA58_10285 [Micromonospora sp. HNM0581]|uniref:DUF6401 family natural product biosynthesis protein n=1 Tax=Micromonospora sp. HNM0581 TaxID=2716341 RepID=UPI00146DAA7E|nr:DUF6401 family natural product biosynthesis protein [Micromonospora sp. HNM0581]NLU78759.1 hypothetical protein [Micromonospora sp. HNM0581]
MRVPSNRVLSPTAVDRARSSLVTLANAVGLDGLAAAAARPGLLAAVDQHAAAVRDSLGADRRPLSEAALAGYADGMCAAAEDHGWRVAPAPIDWTEADWVTLRLLAVCALTAALDTPTPQPASW